MPAKNDLIILELKIWLKNVKQEATSANQEAADEFPEAIKKFIEEQVYLPEQVFNADKSAISEKRMSQRIFIY